jgi:uncharacterized protein (TIGR03437 family)
VNPSGAPGVQISYSGGTTYTPGERGKFTVTVTDTDGRQVYGFQATARLASNLERGQAGTLVGGTNVRVECEDGRATPCRDTAPVQFATHQLASRTNTFEFEWTPPGAGAGDVRVFVAGNAANGNAQNTGDRIHTTSITLTPATSGGGGSRPSISDGGVVEPFQRRTSIAPGSWLEIYGANLSTTTRDWTGAITDNRLPMALDGVSVTVNGKPAAVSYVSPGQVNVLVPADVGTGDMAVVVKNATGETTPMSIRVAAIAPVILAPLRSGDRRGAVLVDNSTGALYGGTGAARPARPGDVVQLYALGLGPTNPALATDRLQPVAALTNTPSVRFGQTQAQVLGSALIAPGLYQINMIVPDVPNGEPVLTLEIGGVRSADDVVISIQR